MKLGIHLRNMGPQSTLETLRACALAAEDAGIDDVWVADHIAIPREESEGSGGRYLDPLATLAFLAAAKWVATVQELSGGRMLLGVGAGWMRAEFEAVGVPLAARGRVTDDTLAFLARCFADDEVESNGRRFLFLPRPPRPPILVGGAPPHAFRRALAWGDGWMPTGAPDPARLAAPIAELQERAAAGGKPTPEIALLTSLPLGEPDAAGETIAQLAA